jgi:hypothetical protein
MSIFDQQDDEAKKKCTKEFMSFFERWEAESDLESNEILSCVSDAIDELYEEEDEEVEFISEIDLNGEED